MNISCADCRHLIDEHFDRSINPCLIPKCRCLGFTTNKKEIPYRKLVREVPGRHPDTYQAWAKQNSKPLLD